MCLQTMARRAAVGMCAQVSQGRDGEANQVMSAYLQDCVDEGYSLPEALIAIARMTVSVAVSAAGDEGPEWFSHVARDLAVTS